MSELIATRTNYTDFRKHLLATVSVLTFASLATVPVVQASEADRPTVWIELGGQAEFNRGTSSPFTAPFMVNQANSGAFDPVSPLDVQKTPRFSFGEEGKISIQPKHSDWIFSASLRYGRSGTNRYIHQQTKGFPLPTNSPMFRGTGPSGRPPQHYMTGEVSYAEYRERQSESHLVLDFQAGKDVGLGLFGNDSTSIFSAGVRMARISSSAAPNQRMRPDMSGTNFVQAAKYHRFYHHYALSGYSERSFRGIGPSVSWNGSASISGNTEAGQLGVDWNANAALLFGRQKMRAHHSTSGFHKSLLPGQFPASVVKFAYSTSASPARSRSVIVPNIGGSFAVAYRFDNAKLDLGYRADLFFNAMDTGMDARKTSNVLYHGPFATLSIGLGG